MKRQTFLPIAKLAQLGVLNVKDFGAVGDGVADDTASIQAAVSASLPSNLYSNRLIVYFPPGRYKVTDTIRMVNAQGVWTVGCHLMGEGSFNRTRIYLPDLTPGFTASTANKPIFMTGDQKAGTDPDGDSGANEAYQHVFQNLHFEIGHNAGAVAIDWRNHNNGAITGCIFSNTAPNTGNQYQYPARAAIRIHRGNFGSGSVDNCHFYGFQHGILQEGGAYDMALSVLRCQFQYQSVASCRVNRLCTSFVANTFASLANIPGIILDNQGDTTHFAKSNTFQWNAGGSTNWGICSYGAKIILEGNTTSFNAGLLFRDTSRNINLTSNSGRWSTSPISGTSVQPPLLAVDIPIAPLYPTTYVLSDYAPDSNGDRAPSFTAIFAEVAALPSHMKPARILVPRGDHKLGSTVNVPDGVGAIMGCGSSFSRLGTFTGTYFQTSGTVQGNLHVENIWFDAAGRASGAHDVFNMHPANSKVLVVSGCVGQIGGYGGSKTIVIDHMGLLRAGGNHYLQAYSWNAEYEALLSVFDTNCRALLLGTKHEQNAQTGSQVLRAIGAGQVQIFGYHYSQQANNPADICYIQDTACFVALQFGDLPGTHTDRIVIVDNGAVYNYTCQGLSAGSRSCPRVAHINNP